MGPAEAYTLLSADGVDIGGAITLPQEALDRGARAHWITYFSVEDVDAAIATAERLGAGTIFGSIPVPGVGRLAGFHDPQGAAFAVLQPER
jgi:predicted enzyme related to lactoylglutathione lyase